MDYDAFSHGQIISKIWLAEELEKHIQPNSMIWVLGSWYSLTSFILLVRKPDFYKCIIGYDANPNNLDVADKICSAWNIYNPIQAINIVADANNLDWNNPPHVVINTSAEHFENNAWFDHIPKNTIVCIQSTNITTIDSPWYVKHPTPTVKEFINQYPLRERFMLGIKNVPLNKQGKSYERYMIIGKK